MPPSGGVNHIGRVAQSAIAERVVGKVQLRHHKKRHPQGCIPPPLGRRNSHQAQQYERQ